MAGIGGVADLQVEQTAGIPQLVIRPDRQKLSRFGISMGQVADLVETALNGMEATDLYESDRVTAVLIRLPEAYRNDEEAVATSWSTHPAASGCRCPRSPRSRGAKGRRQSFARA
jgi:Cu/Ag efflux pump CusA